MAISRVQQAVMPKDPMAEFEVKVENPLKKLKVELRAIQSEALKVKGRKEAESLYAMMERVASLMEKTCSEISDHPCVSPEEVETFQEGVKKSLSIYRGRLAAKAMDESDPELEKVCLFIEKHRAEITKGSGVIPPVVTGVRYPIQVKKGKIEVITEKGSIPYPSFPAVS